MSDKDPVREQIERDAVSFNPDSIYRITAVRDQQLKFFKKGATHQDPIAWNRCLDEVIRIALIKRTSFNDDTAMQMFIQELEKKRR